MSYNLERHLRNLVQAASNDKSMRRVYLKALICLDKWSNDNESSHMHLIDEIEHWAGDVD